MSNKLHKNYISKDVGTQTHQSFIGHPYHPHSFGILNPKTGNYEVVYNPYSSIDIQWSTGQAEGSRDGPFKNFPGYGESGEKPRRIDIKKQAKKLGTKINRKTDTGFFDVNRAKIHAFRGEASSDIAAKLQRQQLSFQAPSYNIASGIQVFHDSGPFGKDRN